MTIFKNTEEEKTDNTLYFKIENSFVHPVSSEESKELLKAKVYHTRGYSYDSDGKFETVIFDFEKDSIIPEIKFLDNFESSKNTFSMFSPATIFIASLACVFLYFNFSSSGSSDSSIIPTSITSVTTPVSSEVVREDIPIVVAPIVSTGSTSIVSTSPNIEDSLRTQIHNLQLDISEFSKHNDLLTSDIYVLTQNVSEAKDEAKKYLQESLSYKEKYEIQKGKNIELDQLKLYLGNTVFDLCEEKGENSKCKEVIYKFYQERQ